jgi:hypothetical protein
MRASAAAQCAERALVLPAGHLKEQGFNAIAFGMVAHSWMRNVEILNADTALNMFGCSFMTIVSGRRVATPAPPLAGTAGGCSRPAPARWM